MNARKILLGFIIVIAFWLRIHNLDSVPAGLHADEASQGYNAFSLAKTGKDMYGQPFPIFFRANGSYQPPVYTYVSIPLVYLLGNKASAIRMASALSGTVLVLLTYLLLGEVSKDQKKEKEFLSLFGALVVAIAPWAIHFSRLSVEANLALTIFVFGVYLFLKSLKNAVYFPAASFVLGLASNTYYSERITSVLFLILMIFIYRKFFWLHKKMLIIGIVIFGLTQIPYLYLIESGAFARRFDQVSYFSDLSTKGSALSKLGFLTSQFTEHYLLYFSPKNLFFDPGRNLGRVTPDLSVFYPWFLIPFLAGVGYLFKIKKELLKTLVIIVIFISPFPAALTGDDFYPLRTLFFLWGLSLVVAIGIFTILKSFKNRVVFSSLLLIIISYSVFNFYVSYFGLFKYVTADNFGYPYVKLLEALENYRDKRIILDYSPRSWGAGIRMAYLTKLDPSQMQKVLSSQLKGPYYNRYIEANEVFVIGNVIVKPIAWDEVCQKDILVVGDALAISKDYVNVHSLKMEFAITNLTDEEVLFGYSTPESGNCETKEIRRHFDKVSLEDPISRFRNNL